MPPRRSRRAKKPALTERDVRRRAQAVGIPIAPDALEATTAILNQALEALREFDTVAERTREPAVTFRP
jgi:hypothetical protein